MVRKKYCFSRWPSQRALEWTLAWNCSRCWTDYIPVTQWGGGEEFRCAFGTSALRQLDARYMKLFIFNKFLSNGFVELLLLLDASTLVAQFGTTKLKFMWLIKVNPPHEELLLIIQMYTKSLFIFFQNNQNLRLKLILPFIEIK